MNITDALLEIGVRISCGNRWLVKDELYRLGGEFVVLERLPYVKKTTEVYRGTDEEEAVRLLLNKDEDEV